MKGRIPATALAVLAAASSAAWAQDFQVGARSKGMGGSYTAFEDDPTSIWMNPAGIATQSTQFGLGYQTYSQYEFDFQEPDDVGEPETGFINPQLLPSFLGVTVQFGTPEKPWAIGIGYVRPVHIKFTYDWDPGGDDGINTAEFMEDQQFSRTRVVYATDLRMKAPGEAGAFTHIAFGFGFDLAYTNWQENAGASDNATAFGTGLGILMCLFDNTESFKALFGLAFQSPVNFKIQRDTSLYPAWDWPAILTMGLTVYLFQGMPLRFTFDLQWIDWENAVEPSTLANHGDFRSVTNFSVGMEYRIKLREDGSLLLYPRLGLRRIQALWDDDTLFPAIGDNILIIDTKGTEFTVITVGIGLYTTNAAGKSRGLDLGFEFGGDTDNVAFGYTHEF
jgi:hypothetical protein